MNQLADDLATGVCTDFSQYKYLTGIIAGLAEAELDVLDVQKLDPDLDPDDD
jgi:hypothetical protein